jgi:hypothetical protein
MTSDVASQDEIFDLDDLYSLDEKMFTRSHERNVDLETLRTVAASVFYGRSIRQNIAEESAARLKELVEVIAIILGKTYVERGDAFCLADDQALTLINDLLLQYDPLLVARNRNKRLPKHLLG